MGFTLLDAFAFVGFGVGEMTLVGMIWLIALSLPMWIAWGNGHKYATSVMLLTALLGWSFVFWSLSLIWASMGETREPKSEE